jgi:serine/threonine protein kinase
MSSQDLQQNILITNETPPRACLADFGLSTLIPGTQGGMSTITDGGTPMFMAPELLCPSKFGKKSSRPTQPGDIYALGLVIYEVLTGSHPFHDKMWGEPEIVFHVMTGVRPTKPVDAEQIGFGDGTWELAEECWIEESTRRPTIDKVLTHLTRVAAHSKIVGPTLDKHCESAVNFTEHDSSGNFFISPSPTTLTSTHKVKYTCFRPHRILPVVRP